MTRTNSAAKRAARAQAAANRTSYSFERWQQRRTYFRSIIEWTADGRAMIFGPADDLHPYAQYEIRHTDKVTRLATVTGQQILDLRRDQLADYLAESAPRGRTNIARVDVASLLDVRVEPHQHWGRVSERFRLGAAWLCEVMDVYEVRCSFCPFGIGDSSLQDAIETARAHDGEHKANPDPADWIWKRQEDGTLVDSCNPGRRWHLGPCAPKIAPHPE